MILALEGKALSWRETLTLAESPNLQRLDLFIAAFTERFIPNKTVLQCVSAVSDLKQKNNEAIRDYYDRVQRGILLSLDSVRRTCTAGEKPGFDKCVQHFIKIHFIFGLRTNIRVIVESKLDTIESMDGLLQAACVAETASRAETRSDNSRFAEMSAEIAALRQQSGFSGRGRGRGRGRGSGGGSSSSFQSAPGGGSSSSADGGPSARQKIALRKGWTNCYKCEQWGKHKANECNLSSCLLYTSPSPRDLSTSRMPSSA